jgi:hypothetical protein
MKNMGLKYTREYKQLIDELAFSIIGIDKFYEFFEMDENQWKALDNSEQKEIAKTLADDIFYALGLESEFQLNNGFIKYLAYENCIDVYTTADNVIKISLI